MINRRIVLAARPQGVPRPEDFRIESAPVPRPEAGEVLLRHTCLGLAPAARLRMGEQASYREPMALGDVVYGQAIGRVVESRDPGLPVGTSVMSVSGSWQEYSTAPGSNLVKVDETIAPPSVWLGALGTSGMTAYVGLLDLGQPREGDTVVVSAASGGVGSNVGQIARQMGCRVVGIAGGAAKVAHVTAQLGFDAAVDYRCADFAEQLRAACPSGVDVYFDNVGGAVRDAVWPLMNQGGRIAVCGLIAEYNDNRQDGPGWFQILSKRLKIHGFIMSDHLHRRADFLRDMASWYRAGHIHVQEDISDGLESVVPAFIRMLTGENFGKTIVRI
ncbi:NADP-dependent oxidoreductase [Ottowia thiooxydans]|uniref:NADP-dependent oxidoreductase n=1 Tax=Ottowia thiooxydans TaxID=219182 RepID=UPI00041FA6FA|nr:NADP-dependent oxidoreductase [Ottowia thiooxydans]